jgi:hypothetical protein
MSALIEVGISQREACRSTGTSRANWNRWRDIRECSHLADNTVEDITVGHH